MSKRIKHNLVKAAVILVLLCGQTILGLKLYFDAEEYYYSYLLMERIEELRAEAEEDEEQEFHLPELPAEVEVLVSAAITIIETVRQHSRYH